MNDIEIIDNSHLHRKHKFYRPGRDHLKLNIKSFANNLNPD